MCLENQQCYFLFLLCMTELYHHLYCKASGLDTALCQGIYIYIRGSASYLNSFKLYVTENAKINCV